MIKRLKSSKLLSHLLLIIAIIFLLFPLYIAIIASTQTTADILDAPMSLLPGKAFLHNYQQALIHGNGNVSVLRMLWVSLMVALGISFGKIILSLFAAFAFIFFKFPFKAFFFALIFATLMLPVEVRISPTFEIVAGLGMSGSYSGIIMPLIASATATFLFRQFFMSVPNELVEAAKVDGAGPMRFFKDILIPLSTTNIAAMFVIQFIYGWNQYLWPLLIKSRDSMMPIVVGIKSMIQSAGITDWPVVMATSILALIIPVFVVLLMQKWFVKGLIDQEK